MMDRLILLCNIHMMCYNQHKFLNMMLPQEKIPDALLSSICYSQNFGEGGREKKDSGYVRRKRHKGKQAK